MFCSEPSHSRMVQQNEQQAGGEDGVYLHLDVQDQAGAVVRYEVPPNNPIYTHLIVSSVPSFRVLTRTKLEKLMNVYCTRMGLNLNAVRFR